MRDRCGSESRTKVIIEAGERMAALIPLSASTVQLDSLAKSLDTPRSFFRVALADILALCVAIAIGRLAC
jgi:hypothetical protein